MARNSMFGLVWRSIFGFDRIDLRLPSCFGPSGLVRGSILEPRIARNSVFGCNLDRPFFCVVFGPILEGPEPWKTSILL